MKLLHNFLQLQPPGMRNSLSFLLAALVGGILCVSGCGDKVRPPTVAQLAAFERAGRPPLRVDMKAIRSARPPVGAYRVAPGDVLEFTMPSLLQAVTVSEVLDADAQGGTEQPFIGRVGPRGTIAMPAIGELAVAGDTLAQIEEKVVDAYDEYVVLRPSILVRVLEYETFQVTVMGAVAEPGIYPLRHDQMSLVALLMEAGGIVEDGAAMIRIARAEPAAPPPPAGVPTSFAEQPAAPAVRTAALLGGSPADHSVRVVFQREGPLYTTGWLTVQHDGQVLTHRWLDISSEYQRQALLQAVAGNPEGIPAGDLQGRLSFLATHLESGIPASTTAPVQNAGGWRATDDRQFVCSLTERQSDRQDIALHAAMDDGAAPVPVSAERDGGADATDATLVLPIVGYNIPFRDVALRPGDTVVVEHIREPLFSVLGLVNRPGNYPYPQNAEYNLAQAIAFAEGLDPVANPRYVTVYRLREDDEVMRVTFRLLQDNALTDALKTIVRPGDVIAVEHTPRTRTNTTIHNLLRINTGVYLTGQDLWDRD